MDILQSKKLLKNGESRPDKFRSYARQIVLMVLLV